MEKPTMNTLREKIYQLMSNEVPQWVCTKESGITYYTYEGPSDVFAITISDIFPVTARITAGGATASVKVDKFLFDAFRTTKHQADQQAEKARQAAAEQRVLDAVFGSSNP